MGEETRAGTAASVDDLLHLACDLLMGLGAFVVTLTGSVQGVTCAAMPPEDGLRRIGLLARNCLAHPSAHERRLFWNAELSSEVDSADRSLACVVAPMWASDTQVGLLGVVDTWLPEPDDDERAGLLALAGTLAGLVIHETENGAPPTTTCAAVTASAQGAGPATAGGHDGDTRTAAVDAAELAAHLDDGVICIDARGTVVLSNRAADALHGLAPHQSLVGSPLPVPPSLRTEDGQTVTPDEHPALRALREMAPSSARLVLGDGEDGGRRLRVDARPFPLAGQDQEGVLVVVEDMTEAWEEQQRLTHFALHDPLTGLANRYLLLEELRRMMQGLARRGGSVTLVFLDLDDFKQINDHHGHDVGDEVLAAVARRLQGAVRADDVVARLGGDEFVIAHAGAEPVPDGDLIVSRLRKVLSAPVRLHGRAFDVGASIGWVSTDTDEVGPDALLAKADRAMYRHKRDRSLARRRAS